jgi:hypothetical protein
MKDIQRGVIPSSSWLWVAHYAVAILIALLLGAILGGIPLFHQSLFPDTRLRASDVVSFMGYGGALILFWLVGGRASAQIKKEEKLFAFLRPVVMPVILLIILLIGYTVVLLVLGPFLNKTGTTFYDWSFIVGIVGASLWLALAWIRRSLPLLESLARTKRITSDISCLRCKAHLINAGRFCSECGSLLPRPFA